MEEPHSTTPEYRYPVEKKADSFETIRIKSDTKMRLEQEQYRLRMAGTRLSLSEIIEKAIAGDFAERVEISSGDRDLLAKVKRMLGPPQTAVEAALSDFLWRLLSAEMHPLK